MAADELVEHALQLAQRFAKTDVEIEEAEVVPLVEPGGFLDLVFDAPADDDDPPCFKELRDARGVTTELGHWLEIPERAELVLRLPWRPAGPMLSDPHENKPGKAHRPGTVTEIRAAELVAPKSGTRRAAVLAAFIADWRKGGLGMTDTTLASPEFCNCPRYSVAPRRHELAEGGWLQSTGIRTGTGPAGGDEHAWALTPAAVEKLKLNRPKETDHE